MLAFSSLSLRKKPFLALSFRKVKLMKLLFFCFVIGLIYGVIVACFDFNEVGLKCCTVVKNFLNLRLSRPFFLTCFYSFLSYFIPIILIFILGFVPISQIVFFIVPIFYGLGFGLIMSCLVAFKGFYGLFIILLEIFPCALISVLVLILSCKEGFRFANKTFKKLFLKRMQKIDEFYYGEEVRIYSLKFFTLFCFQLIASILDGFFNFVFFRI